jgi:L-asparaginase
MNKIKFFTTGGTIDKVYFDDNSKFQVGDPAIHEILSRAKVNFEYEIETLMRKDSLDLSDLDRELIFNAVSSDHCKRIVITHGTDTMIDTAKKLTGVKQKVIVMTGALEPAKFTSSSAMFNVGCAVAAVAVLGPGIYIAMNGEIFHPNQVTKNRKLNKFEARQE